ncbi:NAD(P)H-binding protein [Dyella sp. GSA-30]|uniref:NmrA family NAD(P)-binding protein n=1 Tax=Dyella sp. GSA-30 TaxID=2994496 RepID=UPI002490B1B7|nr:NAD(P)H-binding protein [Dyella sp. GSA-30]
MFAIVGAAGNVGYATARALREANVPVRAIVRDAAKVARLREIGCDIAIADLRDAKALATAIGDVDAVQIILPAALQAQDIKGEMHRAIESLAGALEQATPGRLLAISDYGAHVADDIGMPTVFHAFEERLGRINGHKLILRSAEHMHNWGRAIPVAMASGILPSFHDPLDKVFPTIAAPDLGLIAAGLLMRPASERNLEIVHAEGPRRYSAQDVAAALSELVGRTITAQAVPRSQWKEAFERGVSASTADLLIRTNDAQNKGGLVDVESDASEVCYGTTALIDALRPLLPRQ